MNLRLQKLVYDVDEICLPRPWTPTRLSSVYLPVKMHAYSATAETADRRGRSSAWTYDEKRPTSDATANGRRCFGPRSQRAAVVANRRKRLSGTVGVIRNQAEKPMGSIRRWDSRRRARRDILHADCIDVGGSWTSGYEARSALALDAAAVYLIALSTLALIVRNIPRLKLVWMVPRGCWEGMRTVSFRVTYSS